MILGPSSSDLSSVLVRPTRTDLSSVLVWNSSFQKFRFRRILQFEIWDFCKLVSEFGFFSIEYDVLLDDKFIDGFFVLAPPATSSITWRWQRKQNSRSTRSSILPHASSLFTADDSKNSEATIERSPEDFWVKVCAIDSARYFTSFKILFRAFWVILLK